MLMLTNCCSPFTKRSNRGASHSFDSNQLARTVRACSGSAAARAHKLPTSSNTSGVMRSTTNGQRRSTSNPLTTTTCSPSPIDLIISCIVPKAVEAAETRVSSMSSLSVASISAYKASIVSTSNGEPSGAGCFFEFSSTISLVAGDESLNPPESTAGMKRSVKNAAKLPLARRLWTSANVMRATGVATTVEAAALLELPTLGAMLWGLASSAICIGGLAAATAVPSAVVSSAAAAPSEEVTLGASSSMDVGSSGGS
mmetsp:Transcript_11650/g.23114  ORF Transcript_11650/g.23114 Transcript_11650/m.23114 type:complete len:256 (-) Transcript_11650:276-1043(-)